MGTLAGLLEQERIRQELDEALQKDLEKIRSGVNKREQRITVLTSNFLA